MSRIRRSAGASRIVRLNRSVRLPDIWMAVPSRPAEPPKSWVTMVAPAMSGAMRRGTHSVGSWTSSSSRALPWMARPPR